MQDTSRHNSPASTHGRAGRFLSSLAALALVTITSHHKDHRSHNSLILHHSKPIARLVPAPAHHHLIAKQHGTRVLVQDLFGNMPVRVKQRAVAFAALPESEKEWDLLKRGIVGLLLAWDKGVEVVVRDSSRNKKFGIPGQAMNPMPVVGKAQGEHSVPTRAFSLKLVRSILSRAGYISPDSWDSWVSSSARSSAVKIQGAISLDPAPTKRIQFISCGICPISGEDGNNELYDEINRIFAASSFGTLEQGAEPNGHGEKQSSKDALDHTRSTQKQVKGGRKGVDRWPMFYLRIDLKREEPRSRLFEDYTLDNDDHLGAVLKALGALMTAFLKEHHFRPRYIGKRNSAMVAIDGFSQDEAGNAVISNQQSVHKAGRSTNSRGKLHSGRLGEGRGYLGLLSATIDKSTLKPDLPPSTEEISSKHRDDTDDMGLAPVRSLRTGPASSINNWRRVKSGKHGFLDKVYNTDQDCSSALPTNTPTSAPAHVPRCTMQSSKTLLGEAASSSTSNNLSAQTEKLSNSTASGLVESSEHSPASPTLDVDYPEPRSTDEIVPWTNPVSKKTLLINSRTGLEVTPSLRRVTSSSGLSPSSSPAMLIASPFPNKRPRLSQRRTAKDSNKPAGEWIGNVLKEWKNPVFPLTEEPIRCVPSFDASQGSRDKGNHCAHSSTGNMFQDVTASNSGRLSKEGLSNAEVIAQVDKKFILVSMTTVDVKDITHSSSESPNKTLVLIDQHAADERCRVEALYQEICKPLLTQDKDCRRKSPGTGTTFKAQTMILDKQIKFEISAEECRLFRLYAAHFSNWGVIYEAPEGVDTPRQKGKLEGSVFVKALPPGILERCKAEPRLLIELMRTEVWKKNEFGSSRRKAIPEISEAGGNGAVGMREWLTRIHDCPEGIVEMLNSRACRSMLSQLKVIHPFGFFTDYELGAIMFNDILSLEECRVLVTRLAKCAFPFQCAHGRPSMVPLVGLEGLKLGNDAPVQLSPDSTSRDERGSLSFMEKCMQWKSIMTAGERERLLEPEIL